MAKNSYYFDHDYNARNDEKILEMRSVFGVEGYGIFWMIVESMAENESGGIKKTFIGGLSLGYGVAKERLCEVINFCVNVSLFYEHDGFVYSKRLDKHKGFRKQFAEKGREGAEKRWGKTEKNRGAITPSIGPLIREGNAKESKGEEIRVEERKGDLYKSLISEKNQKNGKQFYGNQAQGEELFAERAKRHKREIDQERNPDIERET